MITRGRLVFVIIFLFLGGSLFAMEAFQVFNVRNAPIITGRIVAREVIERSLLPPKADFTIVIKESEVPIHAHTSRHLELSVQDVVRFRYSGDPTHEVFLFEHEGNPYWLLLLVWGLALTLTLSIRTAYVRRLLRWQS